MASKEHIHVPNPICKICGTEYAYRVHRNIFIKRFLFWMANRRYFCVACNKKYYVTVEEVKKKKK